MSAVDDDRCRHRVKLVVQLGDFRPVGDNEWFGLLSISFIPLGELSYSVADVTAWLVTDQFGGVRDIGVGVFGVAIAGFGILNVECWIDPVGQNGLELTDVVENSQF